MQTRFPCNRQCPNIIGRPGIGCHRHLLVGFEHPPLLHEHITQSTLSDYGADYRSIPGIAENLNKIDQGLGLP